MLHTDWHKRRGFKVLWLAGLVIITVLSLLPGDLSPQVTLSDKLVHFSAYLLAGGVGAMATSNGRRMLLVLAATATVSLGIEVLQMAVPGRQFEWLDFVANSLGLGLAGLAVMAFRWSGAGRGKPADAPALRRPPRQ